MTSGPNARAIFKIVLASGTSPASIRVNIRYTRFARTSCSKSSSLQSNRCLRISIRMTTSAGVPGRPRRPTLRPALLKRLRHHLNHGLVLEQRVDLAQPVGPQFVAIGQQDFEQTPFALSALNHARSFDESACAGSVVRQIDRRNGIERLVAAGRPPSVPVSDLGGHFFTEK